MDCKTDAGGIAYNKQGNHYFNLIQKKKACFTNLKTRDLPDYKTFWRKVKHFFLFSEKAHMKTKITLVRKGKILSEAEIPSEIEGVISKILNDFFCK